MRKSCGGSSSSHLLSHYTFPCIDIGPRELAAAKAQQDRAVDQSAQRQQRSKWSDPFAAHDDAANAAAVLDNQATFKYRKRGTHTHTHNLVAHWLPTKRCHSKERNFTSEDSVNKIKFTSKPSVKSISKPFSLFSSIRLPLFNHLSSPRSPQQLPFFGYCWQLSRWNQGNKPSLSSAELFRSIAAVAFSSLNGFNCFLLIGSLVAFVLAFFACLLSCPITHSHSDHFRSRAWPSVICDKAETAVDDAQRSHVCFFLPFSSQACRIEESECTGRLCPHQWAEKQVTESANTRLGTSNPHCD